MLKHFRAYPYKHIIKLEHDYDSHFIFLYMIFRTPYVRMLAIIMENLTPQTLKRKKNSGSALVPTSNKACEAMRCGVFLYYDKHHSPLDSL